MIEQEMINNVAAFCGILILAYYTLLLAIPTMKAYVTFILDKEVTCYEDKAFTVHSIRYLTKLFGFSFKHYGNDKYEFKFIFNNQEGWIEDIIVFIGILLAPFAASALIMISAAIMTTYIGTMILISSFVFFVLSLLVRYAIISAKRSMEKHVKNYHEKR